MEAKTVENQIKCNSCGAILTYKPGTEVLKCPYCGAENKIEIKEEDRKKAFEEIDYESFISNNNVDDILETKKVVRCPTCGAEVTFEPNEVSGECPFCATPLILKDAIEEKTIKPQGLIPFKIDKKQAIEKFKNWIKKRWFAPSELKKHSRLTQKLQGIYTPYWTYDFDTKTYYQGERGIYYYVDVQTTDENGNTVTKKERRIRWEPVQGTVSLKFDDVLVLASKTIPMSVGGWNLNELQPFNEQFLAGFKTQTYQVSVKEGLETAKFFVETDIENAIKKDIGGDEQAIHSKDTKYSNITFKHILLPLWTSAYKFKGKTYNFVVNGQTGAVNGEYPVSWIKIILLIVAIIAVIAVIYYFASM